MYEIRSISSSEIKEAINLVDEVFMEFEAPDYSEEGINSFKIDIIENEGFKEQCKNGMIPIYGAFQNKKLIGIMALRPNKAHVMLAFVRKEYHRKGVATDLFRFVVAKLLKKDPALKEITVNSSPYGKPFYKNVGFEVLSDEQEIHGIRFVPMKYTIKENMHD